MSKDRDDMQASIAKITKGIEAQWTSINELKGGAGSSASDPALENKLKDITAANEQTLNTINSIKAQHTSAATKL